MEYLKIWTDFREVIELLEPDEKGRLFDAMLDYAADGEEPSLAGNERYIWAYARQTIDRTRKENERLKENGSKGGRPKKQEEPIETNENQQKPAETKMNQQEPKTVKRFKPPTVDEVAEYCKERKNSIAPQQFVDFYTSKGWKVGDQPMKDWKAAVRTWENRDKKGGTNQHPAKVVVAQQYSQRDYSGEEESMDDVLAQLEALG